MAIGQLRIANATSGGARKAAWAKIIPVLPKLHPNTPGTNHSSWSIYYSHPPLPSDS